MESLQFVREDWKLFRSIDTLCQKAGVHREFIPMLVSKELVDNALDISGDCEVGLVDENTFYVSDEGEGIDPDKLEEYFSINRPMISTKLLRRPSRGALGNGLRVVTGAVIATGGKITVATKGYVYKVIPQEDGTSRKEIIGTYDGKGTRVEVQLGMNLPPGTISWGNIAISFTREGKMYNGKSSPHWYNSEAFFELVNAVNVDVTEVLKFFTPIPNKYIAKIEEEFIGRKTNTLTFEEADRLLTLMRHSKEVKPNLLGEVGDSFKEHHAKKTGYFTMGSSRGKNPANLPVVVEAYVGLKQGEVSRLRSDLTICVNKTPVTADVKVSTKQAQTTIWGGGLYIDLRSRPANIYINIITPYMPITSDGKAPDFRPLRELIEDALKKAVSKAKKANAVKNGGKNEKEVILNHLQEAIQKTSGNGKHIFSQRQLYYSIRPYVMEAFDGKQPDYNYFCRVISEYEAEYGDIKGMYRDPRGTLYHPHTREQISLGTIAVNAYNRPKWTFNKILFIEKEGYFASLIDESFPEKYDCALVSSKGFASRAVKDLFDLLGETDEEIQFFCVHDSDAAGTMIYQTLQEATIARPGRRVKVVNLGLDPEEAIEMNLQIETFESRTRRSVADYAWEWEEWLQENRVELNAMTTPQFIEWLERKMAEHGVGKVIPHDHTLEEQLKKDTENLVKENLVQQILKESGFDERFAEAKKQADLLINLETARLRETIEESLENKPKLRWDKPIKDVAKHLAGRVG